jgi:hypothetical protein
MRIRKTDIMGNDVTKITKLKHQLVATRTKMGDEELVSNSSKGLAPSWMSFVQGICAQVSFQSFEIFGLILCMKK